MTEDGNDQIMHNPLQHTAMLEAEMVHQGAAQSSVGRHRPC
jgi:hypothetical protein